MKRLFASIALVAFALSAWALPTADDVQAQVNRGDYAKAESMMLEVVTARPTSAKAHYIYAEILAHNRHFDQAAEEAAQAQKIDPQLQFTQPDKFRAFEQLLSREQAAAKRTAGGSADRGANFVPAQAGGQRSGFPGWIWVLGGAAIALVLWRMFAARRPGATGPGFPANATAAGPAYNNPYGPAYPSAPAPGSGLLGTGMAVAGGVAAGMLAEKLLDGQHGSGSGLFGSARNDAGSPGFFDNSGQNEPARDLEDRPVDFGSGGDWGGDDGGSMDNSGGGSDGW
jgi:hypothetical protein